MADNSKKDVLQEAVNRSQAPSTTENIGRALAGRDLKRFSGDTIDDRPYGRPSLLDAYSKAGSYNAGGMVKKAGSPTRCNMSKGSKQISCK